MPESKREVGGAGCSTAGEASLGALFPPLSFDGLFDGGALGAASKALARARPSRVLRTASRAWCTTTPACFTSRRKTFSFASQAVTAPKATPVVSAAPIKTPSVSEMLPCLRDRARYSEGDVGGLKNSANRDENVVGGGGWW